MRNMAASGDISRVEAAIFLGLTTYLHSSGINTSETIASKSREDNCKNGTINEAVNGI